MTPKTARVQFEPDPCYVAIARNFVGELAIEAGLSLDKVEDARLLASEAVTNAVKAHQENHADGLIELECAFDDDQFRITVIDRAGGFDPVEAASAAGTEADIEREGGFGLPLLEALSDDVTIDSDDVGSEVSTVVYRDARVS